MPVSRKPGRNAAAAGKSGGEPEWRKNPELYGIRTSTRTKKQPDKYVTPESDSDSSVGPIRKKRYVFLVYLERIFLEIIIQLNCRNVYMLAH